MAHLHFAWRVESKLSADERRLYIEQAAAQRNVSAVILEISWRSRSQRRKRK
jgi:hypothetical protein